jgi:hypothetical protein
MTYLCQNHTEYWKTLRRTNTFGKPYTIGFSWFATFPTSKRLRWPVGKAEKVLPWVCTRKELMRGTLTETGGEWMLGTTQSGLDIEINKVRNTTNTGQHFLANGEQAP